MTSSPNFLKSAVSSLRDNYGDGWFLLRLSLHEPLLVLQIENDVAGLMPIVLKQIHELMNHFPKVNQEKLLAHL